MKSVERYNVEHDFWEEIAPMQVGRSSAAAVSFQGLIYVFGGWNGIACRTIECYDPDQNTWSLIGTMDHDRVGLCCCLYEPQHQF